MSLLKEFLTKLIKGSGETNIAYIHTVIEARYAWINEPPTSGTLSPSSPSHHHIITCGTHQICIQTHNAAFIQQLRTQLSLIALIRDRTRVLGSRVCVCVCVRELKQHVRVFCISVSLTPALQGSSHSIAVTGEVVRDSLTFPLRSPWSPVLLSAAVIRPVDRSILLPYKAVSVWFLMILRCTEFSYRSIPLTYSELSLLSVDFTWLSVQSNYQWTTCI